MSDLERAVRQLLNGLSPGVRRRLDKDRADQSDRSYPAPAQVNARAIWRLEDALAALEDQRAQPLRPAPGANLAAAVAEATELGEQRGGWHDRHKLPPATHA